MKITILLVFIFSTAIFAAEKTPQKNEVKGGIVINESLQKLMDIEGVKPIYEICKKDKTASSETEKLLECLWTGVSANQELKKKVQMAYSDELKGKKSGRAPASAETNMTGRTTSVAQDYETDPAVIGLSKFYGDKLDQILDPDKALTKDENKKGMILSTNHRQFIDLYKSELGKTIIGAFTSYCLETDPETCTEDNSSTCSLGEDDEKRKAFRKTNIESLAKANLSDDSSDAKKWNHCIASVSKACIKATPDSKTPQTETVKRSCLIMDYVESARKNIIAADKQKKFYDDLNVSSNYNIVSNAKDITDPKKTSTDSILEMSSKDVTTALEKPLAQDKIEFETCFKDNAIVNPKACEKYLNTNKDANETAIAELGMRQLAQEETLKEELNSSDTKVRDYLKEEGFTKEEIAQMTANKDGIEVVRKEIMERYKNQKTAIIKEMAEKITGKTSSTNGKVDAKEDIDKLKKIRDELGSRSTDLSGLVKFNNIVSSYLTMEEDKTKTKSRNTASLFGEIADMDETQKKAAQEQVKAAKLQENKSGDGPSKVNLDVQTINQNFLNYSNLKNPEDKTK